MPMTQLSGGLDIDRDDRAIDKMAEYHKHWRTVLAFLLSKIPLKTLCKDTGSRSY